MKAALIERMTAARAAREPACLVVDLVRGADRVVTVETLAADPLGAEIASRFRSGESGTVEVDGARWFLNVVVPAPRLVIIGAVHVSQALAPMAAACGFDVTVVDPRTAFATPDRFSGVDLRPEWPQDVLPTLPLDGFTALAAVTHDPKIDDPAIDAGLHAGCFYVGALGSRKTHAKRVERLAALGHGPDAIGRIAAPIGLAIGAKSPAEIAVSILAEIIGALRLGRAVAVS